MENKAIIIGKTVTDLIRNTGLEPMQQLELYNAIIDYAYSSTEYTTLNPLMQTIFNQWREFFDEKHKAYAKKCENGKYGYLGAKYGQQGGRPKKYQTEEEAKEAKRQQDRLRYENKKSQQMTIVDDDDSPF